MNIVFRVDGNQYIGLGHVMRCMSLAKALEKKGASIIFALSDSESYEIIQRFGFDTVVLRGVWNNYVVEIEQLIVLIKEFDADLIVTDSYFADKKYFKLIHQFCHTVLISEIIPKLTEKNVDLFINYNVYMNNVSCDIFPYETCLGSKYAILRSEFKEIKPIIGEGVLVLSGGSDEHNSTYKILEALSTVKTIGNKITVVSGPLNQNYSEIKRICDKNNYNLMVNVTDMARIMCQSKLAVSAGGSTLYELCACGLPTISYSIADNQKANVKFFAENNIIPYAGDMRDNASTVLKNIVYFCENNISNLKYLHKTTKQLQKICDGYGAERVSEKIINMF